MNALVMAQRQEILDAQAALMRMPEAHVELEVRHIFADGVYCREMFIPRGVVVFGKIHKRETLNICSMGDISVITERGITRFKAPATVVSAPGIMKVGYAHEDTVWINVHPTQERDLEKIEAMFIAQDFEELELENLLRRAAAIGEHS